MVNPYLIRTRRRCKYIAGFLASVFTLFLGLISVAHGGEYYVAVDGNDTSPGTKEKPFKTIQRAAETAGPGDTCIVEPGLYRETVTPKNSGTEGKPIAFRADKAGTVTLLGTDPVTGWTKHQGSIYKAKMDWSLGKNNQIFVEGSAMQEARWPNDRDGDPMTPNGMSIRGGGGADHIVCKSFPADWTKEDLMGAVVWALVGSRWSSWTATISGYDKGKKKVSFPTFAGDWWVEARHNPKSRKGQFYLVGALKFLDAPGEWFYDEKTKQLFLWAPKNADPNTLRVEAKSRLMGLAFTERQWITTHGINLQACTIDLDKAAHCTISHSKIHHLSQTRGGRTKSSIGEKSGIFLSGHHNRIESCEIAYSAGSGITLDGTDNAVVNCWIHHINYIGAYCSPISMGGMRHLVSHNTIEYTGRDCIKLGGSEHLIQFNDIGFPGRICHDLGAIYSGGLDGGNTRIRYNFVHDNPGKNSNIGIYLDNYMKNYIVDHNVVWNVGTGIRLNRPTGFCMVLNNTVFKDVNNSWGPWKGQNVQWGCHVMNNLTTKGIKMNREVVNRANIQGEDINNFDVKTRTFTGPSPGAGKGIPIQGITPKENVDIGAWQKGTPKWRAGHDFKNPPTAIYSPADEPLRNHVRNASFEYARYYENTLEKVSPLIYWKPTAPASAVVEYHKGFNSPPANGRKSVHGNSLTLSGSDSGVQQTITTLLPDTEYFFSGYVKHEGKPEVVFSVAIGGRTIAQSTSSSVRLRNQQKWRFVRIRFTTGPNDTQATITIAKKGDGKAYVDDVGVVPDSGAYEADGTTGKKE